MKIRIYGLLLACVASIPLLGMKRGLEAESSPIHQSVTAAHPGQADGQIVLPDDCKSLIIALCCPATRNVLMKVNKFYHFFASPRNITKLILHGMHLPAADRIKEIFKALHAKNKEMFASLLQQKSKASYLIPTIGDYVLTMPPGTFEQFYALLPTEEKKRIDQLMQKYPERKPATENSLYKAALTNCLPADETWTSLVEKRLKQPMKEADAIQYVTLAISNNNTELLKTLINNQSFKTRLKPGKQIPQHTFWVINLGRSCSLSNTAIFDSILTWFLSQRFDENDAIHSGRQENIVYECALAIINSNKHQYLERLLLSIKDKSYFNVLILQLLCYACEYKKYDSITTLLSHTKTTQAQQASVSDHSDHEYLRQYKQVLAALFLDNHNDALNISIVSLCKSLIAADNKEYLRITLDTMAEQPCFTHVATPLLQYALEKNNDECIRILLAYHDMLVNHATYLVQPSTAAEAKRVRNQWIPIVRTLLKQDDTNVLGEIVKWMMRSTPDALLSEALCWLTPVILDGEAQNTLDTLEKILKAFQAVAPSSTKYTEIINETLSNYLDAAITSEQPAGQIIERLLNHGAYPPSGLQANIVALAEDQAGFNSLLGALSSFMPSVTTAQVRGLPRFKEQHPVLFTRLATICKQRQAAQVQAMVAQQQQAALQHAFSTLKHLIEQINTAAIQQLLSTWNSRAYVPIIAQALAFVQEQRKILFEQIIYLKCDRSNPNAQQLVQSLTDKRNMLASIQEALMQKHAQCQYARM